MSKILLLIHNEADVALLPNAAQAIINLKVPAIWVVFSPAISVNSTEAAAKVDADIALEEQTMENASRARDFRTAEECLQRLNGKKLDRAKILRDAWKTAPEEERKKALDRIFTPFRTLLSENGVAIRMSMCNDHFDSDQFLPMLNSFSSRFIASTTDPLQFNPREFSIHWPASVPAPKLPTLAERLGPTSLDKVKFQEQAQAAKPTTRRAELEAMHHSSVKKLARELGLDITDMSTPDVIEAIVNAEAAPKGEPVEAY